MSAEGYSKANGRIFEGKAPFILLCPQCNDALECCNNINKCYCYGCDVLWDRKEVKEMCQFIGDVGPIDFKEESDVV